MRPNRCIRLRPTISIRQLIAKHIDDNGIKTTYLEGDELDEFLKKYPPKKYEGYATIEEMYEDIRRRQNTIC